MKATMVQKNYLCLMAKKSFLTDLTGVISSRIILLVAGLLITVILSHRLGPVFFGIYSAILVLPQIVISFAQLGMRSSSIYHIGRKQFDQSEVAGNVMIVLLITSLLSVLITMAGFLFLNKESYTNLYIVLVLLSLPFRLAMAYIGGIFIGNEQISRSNFINWFAEFLHLVTVVLFVWILDLGVAGALLALVASHTAISAWAFYVLRQDMGIKLKWRKEILKSLLSMGVLFAASFGIIQLNYRIDILLLQELSTMEQVGFYSLGVSIAEKLWQLPLAIGVVLMSRTANATDQDVINVTTAKLVRVSILATLLASLFIFFLAPALVPAIWGEEFRASITTVQYILPGILFISVYRVLNSRLAGIGKPQVSIYVFAPALVLNIVLNLWWIPVYDAFGAVLATNVSYTLGTLAYIFVYAKIVKMPVLEIFAFRKSDFDFLKVMRQWSRRK
jgi:O-antigen/teichoic acid export membrane protein